MSAPKRPRQGEKIVKATWVDQAVALAIQGWSTRRIAAKVNRHHSTVGEALNAEFERVRPSQADVHRFRAVMGEQIDAQLASWSPRSLKGDKDAALAVVRFQDRKAKLYGLDAPTTTKAEHSGPGGAPILFDLTGITDEQLSSLSARLADDAEDDAGDAAGASGGGAGGTGEARGGSEGTS